VKSIKEIEHDRKKAKCVSNAVKFTATRLHPKIEIGCAAAEDEESVIYIRDNGAGFDPAYAHKLFGAFQRLHSQEEFEGTGLGLANIQRIIRRHGDQIWPKALWNREQLFIFHSRKQRKTNKIA
jgi:light-regulated signal transduction histidine kinase (bacteriophytochrome)